MGQSWFEIFYDNLSKGTTISPYFNPLTNTTNAFFSDYTNNDIYQQDYYTLVSTIIKDFNSDPITNNELDRLPRPLYGRDPITCTNPYFTKTNITNYYPLIMIWNTYEDEFSGNNTFIGASINSYTFYRIEKIEEYFHGKCSANSHDGNLEKIENTYLICLSSSSETNTNTDINSINCFVYNMTLDPSVEVPFNSDVSSENMFQMEKSNTINILDNNYQITNLNNNEWLLITSSSSNMYLLKYSNGILTSNLLNNTSNGSSSNGSKLIHRKSNMAIFNYDTNEIFYSNNTGHSFNQIDFESFNVVDGFFINDDHFIALISHDNLDYTYLYLFTFISGSETGSFEYNLIDMIFNSRMDDIKILDTYTSYFHIFVKYQPDLDRIYNGFFQYEDYYLYADTDFNFLNTYINETQFIINEIITPDENNTNQENILVEDNTIIVIETSLSIENLIINQNSSLTINGSLTISSSVSLNSSNVVIVGDHLEIEPNTIITLTNYDKDQNYTLFEYETISEYKFEELILEECENCCVDTDYTRTQMTVFFHDCEELDLFMIIGIVVGTVIFFGITTILTYIFREKIFPYRYYDDDDDKQSNSEGSEEMKEFKIEMREKFSERQITPPIDLR